MFDERAFISKVESAGPKELAKLLERPTVEEERALRAHLGDERYQRMHGMALKRNMTRSLMRGKDIPPKGNVVVIHGIMGAELSVSSGGSGDLTWVNAFRIMRGWVDRLRLKEDGRTDFNSKFKVSATGIMKRYYGELLLALSEKWNVQAFWFDWRKDLNIAADDLNSKINEWYGSDAPVHIVAHSMGGLVGRTFVKRYQKRWQGMREKDPKLASGGRLVQLGTPNFGSFAIPQVITGLEGLVRKIALLDLRHSIQDLLPVFNSFVGSYQMLPSPFVMRTMEPLYRSGTYGGFNVPQMHLDTALNHHKFLDDRSDVEPDRLIYVAGIDQPTFCDIKGSDSKDDDGWGKLDSEKSYIVKPYGDGRVPHRLGLFLKNNDYSDPDNPQTIVPTYYIKEDHGNLSTNARILRALDAILETGETRDLPTSLREARAEAARSRGLSAEAALSDGQPETGERGRERLETKQKEDEARLRISMRRMATTRGASRAAFFDPGVEDGDDARGVTKEGDEEATTAANPLSPEERKVEETVTRGFLAYRGEEEAEEDENYESDASIESAEIEIGLVHGGIEKIDYDRLRSSRRRNSETGRMTGNYPVDAVSVGHYVGVQPAAAELKLDRAISAALLGRDDISADDKPDLLLTQYTERGIIHGKLGQPFILPDPRAVGGGANRVDRVVAIAGMGEPGRFGAPELTVLVRELCWSLGRLKKRHLATVLIGTGAGNLSVREAVTAWMNGLRRALTGSMYDENRRLLRITFVEYDPRRVPEINRHIEVEAERQRKLGLVINYKGPNKQELDAIKLKGLDEAQRSLKRDWDKLEAGDQTNTAPTRVTLKLDAERKTYQFGAITDVASVPERDIVIDPQVVWQANDELAGELNPLMQLERGRFLEELLMPDDLRRHLYNPAPLVMMLDATTARIHWEMVAQPEISPSPTGASTTDGDNGFDDSLFLGTSRGFTRQLRTTFAPPPEPPPPPRRILRVLVVADPAPDAHLPGAQEEGVAIADLFESYNSIFKDEDESKRSRVEVTRLFGPLEATRTNVLRELLVRPYDVLHFAGHCVYQWDGDPMLSGWIFNAKEKEILSANELNRIDRIPKFVFSNACESGITPDRSRERSDSLAPSFAEAFFARGVANFVCTAWPVDDLAAREFALALYSGLLGIRQGDLDSAPTRADEGAKMMHTAMRDARIDIARTPNGRTTWGAYQHYGNPFFQFFYTPRQEQRHEAAAPVGTGAGKRRAGTKRAGTGRAGTTKAGTGRAAKGASPARTTASTRKRAGKRASKKA